MSTDRDMAIQVHSDCWKDIYGTRPRKSWAGHTTAQIEEATDRLIINGIDDKWSTEQWDQDTIYDEDLEHELKYAAFEDRWAEFTAG